MARKSRYDAGPPSELNLIPVMNMVMVIIPLLLLMIVFVKTGVIDVGAPRNAQSTTPEQEQQEEETPIPQVLIYIGNDGFWVRNMNPAVEPGFMQQYTTPIAACGGGGAPVAGDPAAPAGNPLDVRNIPPTICHREGVPETAPLAERLDYPSLYNQLVAIRLNSVWFDRFGEENNDIISIAADPDVPFEAIVRTIDTARFILNPTGGALDAPTSASSIPSYLFGGGQRPTQEQLDLAPYLKNAENERIELFPLPVLLRVQQQAS